MQTFRNRWQNAHHAARTEGSDDTTRLVDHAHKRVAERNWSHLVLDAVLHMNLIGHDAIAETRVEGVVALHGAVAKTIAAELFDELGVVQDIVGHEYFL